MAHFLMFIVSQCGLSEIFRAGTTLNKDGTYCANCNTNRILLGKDTDEKMLPWQIKLEGPAGCGGTLVSMRVTMLQ